MFDEPNKETFTLMQLGGGKKKPYKFLLKLLFVAATAGLVIAYGYKLWNKKAKNPEPEEVAQTEQPAEQTAEQAIQKPARITPTALPPGAERDALKECAALLQKNDYRSARQKAYEILAMATDPAILNETEKFLGNINIELAVTPKPMEEKEDYTVKSGDTLDKISKKFGTTIELIQKSNNIRGSIIRPGDKLRVFSAKMAIHVNKTDNDLVLLANNRFFKRYKVGTGKHGTTPVGTFKINDKIVNPPWWTEGRVVPFGDKENVLGTRWMSITATGDTEPFIGYGIHGTWEDETIGFQSSAGCIRLLNRNVEELFMLVPLGTEVIIKE